uniref:CCHC-type domain-containing protein n=1 Tax=Brassica oleracea var. oleracea TaxID=109376 RepID=A0A0D3BI58_BRAOL
MEGEDGSAHSIGKFDGTDYAFWRMQIEDYLYGKKLHQPLSKKPEKMDQDEWELLDRQVLGVIRLTQSKNVAHNVAKEKTTEGLMKVLSDIGRNPDRNNRSNGRSKSRNGRGQSKFRQPAKCWICGKTGHIKKNCRAPPKKEDNTRGGANLREGSEKKEPGAADLEDIMTPELPQDTATAEEEISQDESGEAEESELTVHAVTVHAVTVHADQEANKLIQTIKYGSLCTQQ